eukprot:2559175-Alexandrium_andersonii.AAC.1
MVPDSQVAVFEAPSGTAGIFVPCVARHRSEQGGPPPTVGWVPRNDGEQGLACLKRVNSLRANERRGVIRRRGEGAVLGLLGQGALAAEATALRRVQDAPQWKAQALIRWFADFGWRRVQVHSPPRGELGWLARGRPNRNGEVWT